MSKLLEAYTTSNGTVFKRVRAKDGRVMRFKDGTPINKHSFAGGKSHLKHKGEPVKLAVPSDSGPGYERIEVNPKIDASALGVALNKLQGNIPGEARETVTIDGVTYQLEDLVELNDRITERFGSDIVFKYT